LIFPVNSIPLDPAVIQIESVTLVKKQKFERFEIRLSGSGGQGLVLAGVILAEALGVYGGRNITQTQSYGPEARGGSSRSDLVVSDDEIYYPKATEPDVLLCLTQESCDQYYPQLKDEGILVVDSDHVRQLPTTKAYALPFIATARERIGTPVVANVVSIAAVVAITQICSKDELLKAVLARAPRGTEDKNRKACELGYEMGMNARKKVNA
jgi:2-oxoglutarate ferredoxin oxidoreductase subunit gamma